MTETWRKGNIKRGNREEQDEEEQENPTKKRRRGNYGGDTSWGQVEIKEVENGVRKWLQETQNNEKEEQVTQGNHKLKQSRLEPWTGTRLMSLELLQEVAGRAIDESEESGIEKCRKEREKEEQEVNNISEEKMVTKEITKEKSNKKTSKKEKPKDIQKSTNQDIRELIRKKKEQAFEIREQSKRNKGGYQDCNKRCRERRAGESREMWLHQESRTEEKSRLAETGATH